MCTNREKNWKCHKNCSQDPVLEMSRADLPSKDAIYVPFIYPPFV